MFNYSILGTGSKSNSYIIEDNNKSFLIDMGYSYKELLNRFENLNYNINNLESIFITHLHKDHCSNSLNHLLLSLPKVKVYTHRDNIRALQNKVKQKDRVLSIDDLNNNYNGFTFTYYETPHDKKQTVSFKFSKYGVNLVIATDLGCVTNNLLTFVENAHILALETNYDEFMLDNGIYKPYIKQRIKNNGGHLSNRDAAIVVKHWLDNTNSENPLLYCVHLSKSNNLESIVRDTIKPYMKKGSMVICSNNQMYRGKF